MVQPLSAESAVSYSRKALEEGAQVLVLPEKWTKTIDNAPLREFEKLATRYSAYIVPGAFEDGVSVVAPIIFPDGDVKAIAKKIHLFRDEKQRLLQGDKVVLFSASGVKIGIEICYDLDFPSVTTSLALKGAEIIVVPAKIRARHLHLWRKYMEVRALENRVAVLSANNLEPPEFGGGSSLVVPVRTDEGVIEPLFYELIGQREGFSIAEIDTMSYLKERIERVKESLVSFDTIEVNV